MNPEVANFGVVAVIIVLLAGSLSLIVVGLVRGLSAKPKQTRVSEGNSAQLEQLQQSVDAIAVEVERIAEAQRFSAKLLAERAEPATLLRSQST
jgi:hypothetical protein